MQLQSWDSRKALLICLFTVYDTAGQELKLTPVKCVDTKFYKCGYKWLQMCGYKCVDTNVRIQMCGYKCLNEKLTVGLPGSLYIDLPHNWQITVQLT